MVMKQILLTHIEHLALVDIGRVLSFKYCYCHFYNFGYTKKTQYYIQIYIMIILTINHMFNDFFK